jgi:hypothetical protein
MRKIGKHPAALYFYDREGALGILNRQHTAQAVYYL